MTDPVTHAYLPPERIRAAFEAAGVLRPGGGAAGRRAVTYCGAGIAASSDALLLTLLGMDDVAVYDGSLEEWARDPACPMESGPASVTHAQRADATAADGGYPPLARGG